MTWIELAKEEAARLGVVITDEQADFILWEQTAFPLIGPDETRRQVAEFIEKYGKNFGPKTEGPTSWDKVKEDE